MGERLIEHYSVQRELGTGSAGVVYQAFDEKLRRTVVLKMLHSATAPAAVGGASQHAPSEALLREARIASSIDHPNVCAIYEVGESTEGPFIVMQYVSGQTLQHLIQNQGALDVFFALSVGIQVAEGLQAAHALGILHRDLKPANVMVAASGLAKILDFGLASRRKVVGGQLQAEADPAAGPFASAAHLGTAAYMAPELFVTLRATEQTDIFALGIILYEMVTGRHPFWVQGLDQVQLEQAIQFREPFAVTSLRASLAPSLEGVIKKALAKNPSQRFDSARAMREALRNVLRSLRVDAGDETGDEEEDAPLTLPPTERAEPSERRNSFFSAVSARLFRPGQRPLPANTLVVAPLRGLDASKKGQRWGRALADAFTARLSAMNGLVVKASVALSAERAADKDLFASVRRIGCAHVVLGSYAEVGAGVSLSWQVVAIESQQVRLGGTLFIDSIDLADVEEQGAEALFTALASERFWRLGSVAEWQDSFLAAPSEDYLDARGLLTKFAVRGTQRPDLEDATRMLEALSHSEPNSALVHSALGIAHYYSVRLGFGGRRELERGQLALEQALELDPQLVEAQVYLTYTLLWRGKKHEARSGVQQLLNHAPRNADAHALAGLILRLDGLYDESLAAFSRAMALNPADAATLFNHRSRVYQYLGRFDLARLEVQRGMRLMPDHVLLRTTHAFLDFSTGQQLEAERQLKALLEVDPCLRLASMILATCLVVQGRADEANAYLTPELFAVAEADCEMAYRMATYYARLHDGDGALKWLRRAIYLGNENYPWFASNQAWDALRRNREFQEILADLKVAHRNNQAEWRRLFSRGKPPRAARPQPGPAKT